ncbi:MAG: 23S rRNA (adenine(2503)-C(2))-methyltransferase RlmN [Gammaproteobacteria bacterium]|jgi:23S rRNA (adenine2503-C2)-methyltransferase|nr:23S rRNA (adenine(2503)-C(2))-methyltransferase RlmN [Gammaproteobacteria bacterium]
MNAPVNLLSQDRHRLEDFFASIGEKPFRGRQVLRWIHQRGVTNFADMTDLARDLREKLQDVAEVRTPQVASSEIAADGTRKWLVQLADSNCIETVFIPEADRGTLCVSSQVGCALNCDFCATARQGYNRNLGSDEIIGQLAIATRELDAAPGVRAISNVVLMGMGEPLLNLDNVVPALSLMLDDLAWGLSWRRVTVSTAGIVPGMDELKQRCPVNLAVSLHAPDDALRDRLVPINRKYPIADLLAACRRFVADVPRKRVTFEYVMLDGVNDSPGQAQALASLLADVPSKVNLIPFNGFPGAPYRRSSQQAIDTFREILLQAGIMTVTRRPRGEDIAAACGQLAGQVIDRTQRSARWARVEGNL